MVHSPPPSPYHIVEVEGFPFFTREFEYKVERDTEPLRTRTAGTNGGIAVASETYEASFLVEGQYAIEQLNQLALDGDIPARMKVEIRPMDGGAGYAFEDSFLAQVTNQVVEGTRVGDVDLVAAEMSRFVRNT